jgi:hypothetical protein
LENFIAAINQNLFTFPLPVLCFLELIVYWIGIFNDDDVAARKLSCLPTKKFDSSSCRIQKEYFLLLKILLVDYYAFCIGNTGINPNVCRWYIFAYEKRVPVRKLIACNSQTSVQSFALSHYTPSGRIAISSSTRSSGAPLQVRHDGVYGRPSSDSAPRSGLSRR